jgi:hypothetical protein
VNREVCPSCWRPLGLQPNELEATCGECRSLPKACGCDPVLPPLDLLLADLEGTADKNERRKRVHRAVRLLAAASVEKQQVYRLGVVSSRYISASDWKDALREAKQDRSRERSGPAASGEPDRPDALDITDEPDAVREITAAISSGTLPQVYMRGRQLVHVSATDDYVVTRDLDDALLRRLIADHLPCTKQTAFGVHGALPEPKTCKAILALMDWPKVQKLSGVASYPLLLPDGSILQESGYDSVSGLYLHQNVPMPAVSEKPAKNEVRAARSFLLDRYLKDFPWADDADKANYLSALISPPLREIIADLSPLIYVTAPERGSGKSLLAELVTILYGGAMRPYPENDGEMRKVITAALRGAEPVIVFDNVEGVIGSTALAALLTAKMWTDRILGGSVDGKWPNDRLWMVTGTNVRLGGDHAQRSVRVAIDYGRPDPDRRTGFAIQDIAQWTQANRGEVVHAVLVLARAWQIDGAPEADHAMRGFTRWARIIGGILDYHNIPGFLANRDENRVHDQDAIEWDRFLYAWSQVYGDRPVLARQVLNETVTNSFLAEAMPSTPNGGPWTPRTLGEILATREGRWYDGFTLRSQDDKHNKVQRWQVSKVDRS